MKQPHAYRFRCYPTPTQAAVLARTFGCARYVYNWALHLRREAYQERQEQLSYQDTSAALTTLKQQSETSWLCEVSSVPLHQTLRHLDPSFRNFFAKRARYPRFKQKRGKQSATYASNAFRFDAATQTQTQAPILTLAKMDGAAGHPVVTARASWCTAYDRHGEPGYRRPLFRLVAGRGGDRAVACGGVSGGP